jgi:8-oxo-dGTP pyrophosphatase MutT (NUDIX family)
MQAPWQGLIVALPRVAGLEGAQRRGDWCRSGSACHPPRYPVAMDDMGFDGDGDGDGARLHGGGSSPAGDAVELEAGAGEHLRVLLQRRLAGFGHRAQAPTSGQRHAAVCLAVTELGHGQGAPGLPGFEHWCPEPALLLTRRAAGLRSHAGQWALPGGRLDAGETPEQAALRELAEELGLLLGADSVLGRLDDYVTRSGYLVTPLVVWAGAAARLQPNPAEVAGVHRIPLSEFLRADAPWLDTGPDPGRPVLRMPVGTTWIAAPTAAFLYQFREVCLRDVLTRVDHFDQPAFAWR